MKRAIIYIRRSTASDERTVSLEAQEQASKAYIKALLGEDSDGVELAGIHTDDGVSGGDADRFFRIDAALRGSSAEILVVYNLDRLSRNTEALLRWLGEWEKRGIEVYACDRGKITLATAAQFFMTAIEAVVAEHYRRLVGEKVKHALAIRRAQGRVYGSIPYGYRREGNALVEDPHEQQVIEIIQSASKGGMSLKKIQALLSKLGYTSRKGSPMSTGTIHKIRKTMELQGGELPPIKGEGMVPFGYSSYPPHGPDKAEREVIAHCIRLQSEGLTYRKIAEQLTEMGYANRRGGPFSIVRVHEILREEGKTRTNKSRK